MSKDTLIAIDLAKTIFQVGLFKKGKSVKQWRMKRCGLKHWLVKQAPSVVVMESGYGSGYWARFAQGCGHKVKMLNPRLVKAYRTGQKTDRNDVLAIAAASLAPNSRASSFLTEEQQVLQSVLRMRELLSNQKRQVANQLRGLLMEFGVVINKSDAAFEQRLSRLVLEKDEALPLVFQENITEQYALYHHLAEKLEQMNKQVERLVASLVDCQRLKALEGVGSIGAAHLVIHLQAGETYRNGREAAACIGLTPQQHSSGHQVRLGKVSKMSKDNSLRSVLFLGARSVAGRLKHREARNDKERWLKALVMRRGVNCAAMALANKTVRTAYAMLKNGTDYQVPALAA